MLIFSKIGIFYYNFKKGYFFNFVKIRPKKIFEKKIMNFGGHYFFTKKLLSKFGTTRTKIMGEIIYEKYRKTSSISDAFSDGCDLRRKNIYEFYFRVLTHLTHLTSLN